MKNNFLNLFSKKAFVEEMKRISYQVTNNIFFMGDSHNTVIHNNIRSIVVGLTGSHLAAVRTAVIAALTDVKEEWQIYGVLLTRDGINDEVHPFIARAKECTVRDIQSIYEAVLDNQSKAITGKSLKEAIKDGDIHAYGYMFFPMGAYDLPRAEEMLLDGFESGKFRYHDKLHVKHRKTYTEALIIDSLFKTELEGLEHNPDWKGKVQAFK